METSIIIVGVGGMGCCVSLCIVVGGGGKGDGTVECCGCHGGCKDC